MSHLCFGGQVASWPELDLVEERNNVLTIYSHPLWAGLRPRMRFVEGAVAYRNPAS
jgi:hypothetical protein